MCRRHRIKRELTTAQSPKFNGVAERALGIIEKTAKAGRIEAALLFPEANIPQGRDLWAEAMIWACDTLNRSATTANPARMSPHEMWHGSVAKIKMLPFLKPLFYRPATD